VTRVTDHEGDGAEPEEPSPAASVQLTEVVPAEQTPTSERVTRERVRWVLASILAGTFLLTVAAAFAGAQWGRWANVREWLQAVLPAETAILGSAIGFYFGTQRPADGKSD
jgi:hypothetical protein